MPFTFPIAPFEFSRHPKKNLPVIREGLPFSASNNQF
jgi:hypothetical protein